MTELSMKQEFHLLPPEELRARLNGLDDETIRQLAAAAVGMAQARDSHYAPAWRKRIIETYKQATKRIKETT